MRPTLDRKDHILFSTSPNLRRRVTILLTMKMNKIGLEIVINYLKKTLYTSTIQKRLCCFYRHKIITDMRIVDDL